MTVTRFSVFIPVWNDANWLPMAIESLLAQTHEDWELVIGDNASTDDLEALVGQYGDPRIRYHRWDRHLDYVGNANRTIGLCRFEWLQFLSADDRLHPSCLAAMAACIRSAAQADAPLAMVLTGCRRVDPNGQPATERHVGTWRVKTLESGTYTPESWLRETAAPGAPPWNIGSLAIAAETYRTMGGFFREEVSRSADLEVALRAGAYGPVGYVAEPLMDYMVRGDSLRTGLARLDFERAEELPPVAGALLSALAVHEHRGGVAREDRRYVMAQVADQLVGRALHHRYLEGGRGRRGAMGDLVRATYYSPRWLVSGRQLARASVAVVAPRGVIVWLKRRFMLAKRYF